MNFLREYGVAIVVAVFLHAILLYWLAMGFSHVEIPVKSPEPKFIKASVVKLKPEAKPVQAARPKPKAQPEPKPEREQQKQQEKLAKQKAERQKQEQLAKQKAAKLKQEQLAKQQAEKLKQEQLAKQKAEAEAKQKAEQERKKRAEALLNNLPEENVVEQQQSANDEQQVASYIGIIQQAIMVNWSRPPSARNGMQVLLDIKMIPNGTIVSVNIAKGSGNEAFDRSAVAAVKKTERIPEIIDMDGRLFESYFRHYQLLFKPEDLRL